MDTPEMIAPSTSVSSTRVAEDPKVAALDRDRFILLTLEVADLFAVRLNTMLQLPRAERLLTPERKHLLARIINEDTVFPFTATVTNDALRVVPCLSKTAQPGVLKDISNGVTEVNRKFISELQPGEGYKMDFAMLFQGPIHDAYTAAGMSEGSHTKYYYRGC